MSSGFADRNWKPRSRFRSRMPPAQPADAVKPQAPQIVLLHAPLLIVFAMPPLPAVPPVPPVPVREVPTRTIQLRI